MSKRPSKDRDTNCFKILIFSGIDGKCSRFTISKRVVSSVSKALIVLLLLAVTNSIYFINKHFTILEELKELPLLKKKTLEQKSKIDSFTKKISTFEKTIEKLELMDRKIRGIMAIEKDKSDEQFMEKQDINEPVKNISLQNATFQPDRSLVNALNKKIDSLNKRAGVRLISFQGLKESLKNKKLKYLSIPSIWPTKGWITSGFGYRRSPFTGMREVHEGIDIAAAAGSPVVVPSNGIVIRTGTDKGYGKIIEVDHGYGIVTRYGHNSKLFVRRGDKVKRGQLIALVGSTGLSTGSHLHYEVLLNGVPVNPVKFLINE